MYAPILSGIPNKIMKKYVSSAVLGLLLVSGIIFILNDNAFALNYQSPDWENFIPKTVILNLIQDPNPKTMDSSFRWNDKKIAIPSQATVIPNQVAVIPGQKIVIPDLIRDPNPQTASLFPYVLRQLQDSIDLATEFIQGLLPGESDEVAVIPDLIRDLNPKTMDSGFRWNDKVKKSALSLLQIQPLPLQDKANELLQNLQQYKTEFIQAPVPAEFRQASPTSDNVSS